jgi:N-acetylglucosaminyl-diphospho-decaprenol L-rhamnosyltransferase
MRVIPDLAVVIVTWNVRDLIVNALESLYTDLAASGLQTDVYVVDSASQDSTPDIIAAKFPQVKLTASTENLGFGKANNLALRQIGFGSAPLSDLPPAVYLLNPDTITHPGATRALYDALMMQPKVRLVGARLSYEDGSFQHSAFGFPGLGQLWVEFFPTPGRFIEGAFNGRYSRQLYDSGRPFPVDFVLGATMMLKREVIQQTGMFDETFFMYCEEIDWAWRIRQAGWQVQCVPTAHVTHLAGKSTSQVRPRSLRYLWTSRLLLAKKHYPRWKQFVARGLIAVGMRRKAHLLSRSPEYVPERDNALLLAYEDIAEMALDNQRALHS